MRWAMNRLQAAMDESVALRVEISKQREQPEDDREPS
jgi:hypothetical protein